MSDRRGDFRRSGGGERRDYRGGGTSDRGGRRDLGSGRPGRPDEQIRGKRFENGDSSSSRDRSGRSSGGGNHPEEGGQPSLGRINPPIGTGGGGGSTGGSTAGGGGGAGAVDGFKMKRDPSGERPGAGGAGARHASDSNYGGASGGVGRPSPGPNRPPSGGGSGRHFGGSIRRDDGGNSGHVPDAPKKRFTNRCRLFIGNLPMDTKEAELREILSKYGECSELYLSGKGFAFARLATRSLAEAAKEEVDGSELRGRPIRVRFAVHGASIRIKELSPFVSNELLYQAFAMFGEVERAVHIVDEKGRPTGEGIVEFERKPAAAEAIRACKDNVFLLTGSPKPVVVEALDPKDDEDGLVERMIPRGQALNKEREQPPRFAPEGSFEHVFGGRWKELYQMEQVRREQLEAEFKENRERLENDMELAYQDYQTQLMREELRRRQEELDRLEKAKRERMEMMQKRWDEERMQRGGQQQQQQPPPNQRFGGPGGGPPQGGPPFGGNSGGYQGAPFGGVNQGGMLAGGGGGPPPQGPFDHQQPQFGEFGGGPPGGGMAPFGGQGGPAGGGGPGAPGGPQGPPPGGRSDLVHGVQTLLKMFKGGGGGPGGQMPPPHQEPGPMFPSGGPQGMDGNGPPLFGRGGPQDMFGGGPPMGHMQAQMDGPGGKRRRF